MPYRTALCWTAAVAPIVVYLAAIAISVWKDGYLIFGRTDLAVLLLIGTYTGLLILAASSRTRLLRLVVAVSASFLALGLAEAAAWFFVARPLVDNYPWPPMKVVRKAIPEVSPGRQTVTFTVNRYGVRGRPTDPRAADFSILCIGGSTTECLYNSDEASWPAQVETTLAELTRQSVVVDNAGRSGHIAANHAYMIRHYEAVDRFDLVVVLCGVNDLGLLLRGQREERLARVADETLFFWNRPHEALYRRLRLWRWMEAALNVGTPVGRGRVFQDPQGDWIQVERRKRSEALVERTFSVPPANLQAGLDAYRHDLLGIVQAARQRGVRLALMTQPTLWRADLPHELAQRLWENTDSGAYAPEALEEAMNAYNRVLVSVCEETKTPCLDLAARLPKDGTVFYDDCHFHDAGCQKVARIVSEWLADEQRR